MQSISVPSIHLLPALNPADTSCDDELSMVPEDSGVISMSPVDQNVISLSPGGTDPEAKVETPTEIAPADEIAQIKVDFEVPEVEQLLARLFEEEIERALAEEAARCEASESSNLIEFPLAGEPNRIETIAPELALLEVLQEATLYKENLSLANTIDFSPSDSVINDPVLETDLTKFTPSIIAGDDDDYGQLQAMVDAQQEQLAALRAELRHKDTIIRAQAIDLASKDDQLKYLPELFDKALRLANAEANNLLMARDLEVEKLVNEELNAELIRAREALAALDGHMLVKFGRALGVISR